MFKLNCLFNCYSELPGDWTNFITFRESLVILCVSPVQYAKVSRLNGVNWMFQMSSFNPIKILLIHLQTLAELNKIINNIWYSFFSKESLFLSCFAVSCLESLSSKDMFQPPRVSERNGKIVGYYIRYGRLGTEMLSKLTIR